MAERIHNVDSEWYKLRLTAGMICILAAFFVLLGRLYFLQIVGGHEYTRLSENNCIRLQSIEAPRGLIYDRNSTLLVDNRPSFDVNIIPKDARPIDVTISKLATYTDLDVEELALKSHSQKGRPEYKPIVLMQDIDRDLLATVAVHRFDLPGIDLNVRPKRQYIRKESAAHLLGYLGEINSKELDSGRYPDKVGGDYIGKFGVERSFEHILSGKRGGRQVEVDSTGQVVRVIDTVEATAGHNIHLTIDIDLQRVAENLLDGKAGAVTAMDPFTGEIYVMASSPAFDQNAFVSGLSQSQWSELTGNPLRPLENKAIQGQYPPASTYKIITALAGLEEKVIDINSTFFCPGFHRFGDRVFRCWKRGGHGHVNIVKAISESCDVYFYHVGQKLGVDRLAWYAKSMGLGTPTGINLAHEAHGLIPTAAWKRNRTGVSWMGGETLSVAIGQGYNLATPLQMLSVVSAIANGGDIYRPLILREALTPKGEIVTRSQKQLMGKIPVHPETMRIIRKGLWEVVNGKKGTARMARIKGIDISGKTGTAQLFSRKANESIREEDISAHLKSHAWFVAYAPAEKPQIAVSVIVEHGEHGSSGASPIARDLIKAFLEKKGILVAAKEQTKP